MSADEECRICHEDSNEENLIEPCWCKGSLAKVHSDCLRNWLITRRSKFKCELCSYKYTVKYVHKYTFIKSIQYFFTKKLDQNDKITLIVVISKTLFTLLQFLLVYPDWTPFNRNGNTTDIIEPNFSAFNLTTTVFSVIVMLYFALMFRIGINSIIAFSIWFKMLPGAFFTQLLEIQKRVQNVPIFSFICIIIRIFLTIIETICTIRRKDSDDTSGRIIMIVLLIVKTLLLYGEFVMCLYKVYPFEILEDIPDIEFQLEIFVYIASFGSFYVSMPYQLKDFICSWYIWRQNKKRIYFVFYDKQKRQ